MAYTYNFGEPTNPDGILNVLRNGEAYCNEVRRKVRLKGKDILIFNGIKKTYAEWISLADNDIKEFYTILTRWKDGKIVPIETFSTDTDYAVCIYIVKGTYRVTVYDTVLKRNVEKCGKFDKWFDAVEKARQIVEQYKIN